ncbi:MAG TPA: hypothetical protein VJN72_04685 [Gaiellales bacterium]|nr:hypothetical protein [Gaiellales bacterium]
MRMPIGRTIAALGGAASLALGGAAYAASGHHAAHSQEAGANASMAAAVSEPTSPDTDNIQSGDQTTPDAAAQVKSAAEQTAPDTDNIQSGDQTTPDNGTSAGSSQGGSGSDAPGEQAGESDGGSEVVGKDGPGGHADEPGNPNADHQFQGQE